MSTVYSSINNSTNDRIYDYLLPVPAVETGRLRDGTPVLLSPIQPEEADLLQDFVRSLSPGSRYRRFFSTLAELSPTMLARATQSDTRQHLGLLAKTVVNGAMSVIGWAEYGVDGEQCEIGLAVAEDWQGRGVGRWLVEKLIVRATEAGFTRMRGTVLATNHAMLQLARQLGFTVQTSDEDAAFCEVRLGLNRPAYAREQGVPSSSWQGAAITARRWEAKGVVNTLLTGIAVSGSLSATR